MPYNTEAGIEPLFVKIDASPVATLKSSTRDELMLARGACLVRSYIFYQLVCT